MISVRKATDLFLISMDPNYLAFGTFQPTKSSRIMKHILIPCMLLCMLNATGQSNDVVIPSADALQASVGSDLVALNTHFAGTANFQIDKRQRLVVDYLASGKPYRTDVVYIEFLDAATCSYNAEEKTLTLQCQDERSKCIDKEIHKTGVISPTGRMSLPLPSSDPTGEKAKGLLVKLVDDKQNEQLTRLAETNTRPKR